MKCQVYSIKRHSIGDYPGMFSTTFLLGKCGLCKTCKYGECEETELDDLKKAVDFDDVNAIFINGCEPLLHYEMCESIAKWAKKNKLKVGINTFGLFEKQLRKLVENKLVDFVRLEIRAPLEYKNYKKEIDITKEMFGNIKSSIGFLRASGINYEFYTKLNKGIGITEAEAIYSQLLPCRLYVLDYPGSGKNEFDSIIGFLKGKDNVLLRMQ